MSDKTNRYIEKTFSYKVPDAYLYQTSNLNKTAQWTYRGPDKLWIFADASTGKIISGYHCTERDDGANVPTPEGQIKVFVDAEKNPLIASLCYNTQDYGQLPHITEQLPGGATYSYPDPMPPDHTYELTEIVYDQARGQFAEPFPWKQPHMTWEELKSARDSILLASDSQMAKATDPAVRQEWEKFRQEMRDITKTFAGVDPWKVPFPSQPTA